MGNQANKKHHLTTRDHLHEWYTSAPVGRRLRQQVVDELDSQLERLFGYHTLFLGVPPDSAHAVVLGLHENADGRRVVHGLCHLR